MSRHSLGPPGERLSLDGVVGGSGCRLSHRYAWPSVARQKSRGCCHASIYAHHTTPAPGTSTSGMKPPPRLTHETLGEGFYGTKRCTREKPPHGLAGVRSVSVCGLCLMRFEKVIERMTALAARASYVRGGVSISKPLLSARAKRTSCASCMPWRPPLAPHTRTCSSSHHAPICVLSPRTPPNTSGLYRHSFGSALGTPQGLQT